MKRLNFFKTMQLMIMLAFLAVCVWLIFFRRELYHEIAQNPNLKMLSGMLWACFGLNLIFLFIDFTTLADIRRDFRELDCAAQANLAPGPDRNGSGLGRCAVTPVPAGVGCVALELSNIREVIDRFGESQGSALIREFSVIVKMSAVSLCVISPGEDNPFLAVFDNSSRRQVDRFLERLDRKVKIYNENNPEVPIAYRFGVAIDEPEKLTMIQLAALANRRMK